MALLSSSWSLLGRSWSQKGSQNGSESGSKMGPKTGLKKDPKFNSFWTYFGAILGSKTGRFRGPFFGVSQVGQRNQLHRHLGSILGPKVLVFHRQNTCHVQKYCFFIGKIHAMSILGPSWRPLGAILAPSRHNFGHRRLHKARILAFGLLFLRWVYSFVI